MNCPRCDEAAIVRTVGHSRAGYSAAILCEMCERQVCIIRDDPGDAIDAAETLFFERSSSDGRNVED